MFLQCKVPPMWGHFLVQEQHCATQSAGCHANSAIQANHLAVEIGILEDVEHQRSRAMGNVMPTTPPFDAE